MANDSTSPKKFKALASTLALGVNYVDQFWGKRFIFPIQPGAKFPPKIKDNLEQASSDPAQIEAWHKKFPGCNWGVALRKSKLMAADVDVNQKKGKVGQTTFNNLDLEYGWPATETTTTPTGGTHLYYEGWATDEHPEHIMAIGEHGLGKDIDVPNYCLIPGCTFDDGTSYTTNGVEAVRCPEWIYDVIKTSKTKSRIVDAGEVVVELDQERNIALAIDYLKEDAEPSIEGSGGDFNLYKAAAYLKDIGISQQLGAELLNEHFNPRCEPPWDMDDLVKKMAGAYAYTNLSKVGGKTAEADFDGVVEDTVEPMGIFNRETKVYDKKPENIGKKKREREKAQEREDAKPVNIGARKYTRASLTDRWVYVRGMERFVCRDDPPPRKRGDDWDPDVNERPTYSSAKFDKAFRSLCKKSDKSISDMLLREKKGGILHFESMVYRPGKPEFAGENYNVYRPSPITIAEAATDEARADLKFWNDHLTYLFPNDAESRDHVLNYLAWRIQHPGEKMKHAMILQGRCKGTGKSFVGRVIAEILGASNIAYPRETDLSNKFNAWAAAAQFIIIEELRAVEKRKIKANLHPMISEERLPVEYKGVDTKQFVVCFGILAYTNEDAALSIDKGDRRYLVVRSEAIPRDKPEFGSGFDVGYYTKLFDILKRPDSIGAIAWELKNRDLGSYNAAASAPMTKAKKEMTDLGGTPVEQWMIENHDKWPLCARLTTIEEIRQIMPKHLIDRYVDQNIAEALIGGAFAGARIRVPVNTIKTRLWSINNEVEVNRLIAECDAASRKADKITVANRNAALAAIYEADKVAAGKGQPVIGDGDED